MSLQQKYFELKIQELKLFENREDNKNFEKTKKEILAIVKAIKPNDDIIQHHELFEKVLSESIFDNMVVSPYEELQKIAPITRYYDKHTADELRFLIKNEQLVIAFVKGEETKLLINKVASDINALSKNISKVQDKEATIKEVLSPKYWKELSLEKIQDIKKEFTPLMKYRVVDRPDIMITDIDDAVVERRWIEYADGKKMESDKYRAKFVQQLEEYAKSSTAIQKILNDQELSKNDIAELESMLNKTEYHINVFNLRKVFHTPTANFEQLIKVALGKEKLPEREKEVNQLFDSYIHQNNFNSVQIKFLRIVKALIIQKKHITYEDFYSPAFEGTFGVGAFDRIFKEDEAKKLMEFVAVFSL
jgi:type I restriction enzyme R subunit